MKMNLSKSMNIDKNGILKIGDFTVTELVEKYGTPLLVYDELELRENIKKFINGFKDNYPDFTVAYAGKAFLNRTLCRILEDEGTGLDVVSGGELYIALSAGFPAERIFFHGNNKSYSEIKMGIENNIGRFMIDNEKEAEIINDIAGDYDKKIDAILRVIPGIEAHTHEYIKTGHQDSKFGVGLADGLAMKVIEKIINYDNINIKGIHAHIGSQIFDVESYQKLIEIMLEFMQKVRYKTGITLSELDLGGGLGIPHLESDNTVDIKDYVQRIINKVKEETEKKDYPLPSLIIEPGRSIVGTAGITLYTVGSIKNNGSLTKYLAIDGGMPDNIRPALYKAEYEGILANRLREEKTEEVTIAGKCCESGDILIKDIKLQAARSGDILAVAATGAYTYSMSSNYNGLRRPAIVLVNKDRENLIMRRESYKDLVNNDLIPEDY